MNTDSTIETPGDIETPTRSGMMHKLIIVVLGVASFAIGFLLVHFTIPKETTGNDANNCAEAENIHSVANDVQADASDMAAVENNDVSTSDEDEPMTADANGGLPEVPPGATPDGIRLDGAPLYFKCWVRAGDTGSSKECDRLRILEKRMATRLYVIDECRQQHAGENERGLLSLGANLNFADNTISFWSGPSSTIAGAQKVGNCVRQKLAGLPLSSITHKHEKYRIFFTVNFFDPKEREQHIARLRNKGREVMVTMDKVNVREEPIDGASLGRISSDSKVVLLKKNDTKEWCQVLTPNNRIGWMICKALKL